MGQARPRRDKQSDGKVFILISFPERHRCSIPVDQFGSANAYSLSTEEAVPVALTLDDRHLTLSVHVPRAASNSFPLIPAT